MVLVRDDKAEGEVRGQVGIEGYRGNLDER